MKDDKFIEGLGWLSFVLIILLAATAFFSRDANATNKPPPPPQAESTAVAGAQAGAAAGAASKSSAASDATGGNAQAMTGPATSSANNEGTTVTNSTETNTSQVVLVPNNNTESCIRVFGLAFGKNGESGAIGWPWRSKKCDYEQAADDAFAAGERELGWFWKCKNPNLYKAFASEGMTKAEASEACHEETVGMGDSRKAIADLQEEVQKLRQDRNYIQQERMIEREKCEESKDRIADACLKK